MDIGILIAFLSVAGAFVAWLLALSYKLGKRSSENDAMKDTLEKIVKGLDDLEERFTKNDALMVFNDNWYQQAVGRLEKVEEKAERNASDHAQLFTEIAGIKVQNTKTQEEVTKTYEAVNKLHVDIMKMGKHD